MESRLAGTRSFRPEASRLWLRRALRQWPGCAGRWVDLGAGRIRRGGDGARLPAADAIEIDGGLLYLPPVDRELAPARDALVSVLARRGVPLLVQLAPEESLAVADSVAERVAAGGAEVVLVVDLLEALLAGRSDALDAVPRGAIVLWPLLPGLTDDATLCEEGCARLTTAGVACVQAVAPELTPADRRELAGGEHEAALFSRLFHGRTGGERRFAVTAAAHGLDVFFRRRPPGSDRRSRNAALAELLALGAELWLRLGRGEVSGQELYRASRWVEDTAVDVRALAAEGNLEIVEALRDPAAQIVEQWARTGGSAIVEQWLAEYVAPPPGRP